MCAAVWLAGAAVAEAQVFVGSDAPRRGSVEISGGGVYQGGKDLGRAEAILTGNPAVSSEPLVLFTTDSELTPGFGGQARLAYYLTSALALEGGVQLARPKLEVRTASDFEAAPETTARATVKSYLFTGSAVYHFGRGPFVPFLIGGAGHVRELYDGDDFLETGLEYHAGGGIKSWFGSGRRRFGIRAEALFSSRNVGIEGDRERRSVPTFGFSFAYLF
jgi:hypothetical protein